MITYFYISAIGIRKIRNSRLISSSLRIESGVCKVKLWWRDQGPPSAFGRERKTIVWTCFQRLQKSYVEEEMKNRFWFFGVRAHSRPWCEGILKSQIVSFFTTFFHLVHLFFTIFVVVSTYSRPIQIIKWIYHPCLESMFPYEL